MATNDNVIPSILRGLSREVRLIEPIGLTDDRTSRPVLHESNDGSSTRDSNWTRRVSSNYFAKRRVKVLGPRNDRISQRFEH